MACLRLQYPDAFAETTYNLARGGDTGLTQRSNYISTGDANELTYGSVAGPLLWELIPRDVHATALGGNTVLTKIDASLVATLNPDAGTTNSARSTIELGATDYFRSGFNGAIRRNFDLLEVTIDATGQVIGTFRVYQYPSDNRVELRGLTGALTTIGRRSPRSGWRVSRNQARNEWP